MSRKNAASDALIRALTTRFGEHGVSFTETERALYARDSNFRDVIRSSYKETDTGPIAIIWPEKTKDVADAIVLANKHNLSVVPYGGGSGVCRAFSPNRKTIVIDLKRMNAIRELNADQLYIDAECGIYGLTLERYLEQHGLTLGHFPSSILAATLGGYLAARSAGQASSRYGKIEDMILDLEGVDGRGNIFRTSDVSLTSGLDWNAAIVGSEGSLGIITSARLRIFPQPKARTFLSFRFDNIASGLKTLRQTMQAGYRPAILRLYDEADTLLMFTKGIGGSHRSKLTSSKNPWHSVLKALKSAATRAVARHHTHFGNLLSLSHPGCALIAVLEGHPRMLTAEAKALATFANENGGKESGPALARHWYDHRYSVSFKSATVFRDGCWTDTMEVATSWDRVNELYKNIRKALADECLVLAHVSHVYAEGAAIYFTFLAPLDGLNASLTRYDRIWQKGMQAAQSSGAVISHHHGVGRLKATFLKNEWHNADVLFTALKDTLDPKQRLNPGVFGKGGSAA